MSFWELGLRVRARQEVLFGYVHNGKAVVNPSKKEKLMQWKMSDKLLVLRHELTDTVKGSDSVVESLQRFSQGVIELPPTTDRSDHPEKLGTLCRNDGVLVTKRRNLKKARSFIFDDGQDYQEKFLDGALDSDGERDDS